MTTRTVIAAIGLSLSLLVLSSLCPVTAKEQPPTAPGGTDRKETGAPMPLVEKNVLRSGPVRIPSNLGDPGLLQKGMMLTLTLFDDVVCRAEIFSISRNILGTVTVLADVKEPAPGHLVAVTTEGRSLITVTLPRGGRQFRIAYDDETLSYRVDEVVTDEGTPGPGRGLIPRKPEKED